MRWLGVLAPALLCSAQDARIDRALREAVQEGTAYLLEHQNDDGSWGDDGVFGKDPGIRSSVTSIAIMALRAAKRILPDAKVDDAIARGFDYLRGNAAKRPERPFQGLYNFSIYGSMYAAALLAREDDDKSREALEKCLALISKNQRSDGGYSYLHEKNNMKVDSYETFPTAMTLECLWEVKKAGKRIPEDTFKRALTTLKSARTADGYFCYHVIDGKHRGSVSGNGKLSWPASIARTVCCEYVLVKIGQGSRTALKKSIEMFFRHREELEKVRKKDQKTHQGDFDCAPYYYLFGHYYACRALFELDKSVQQKYVPQLQKLLLDIRESDGTWLDSRVCGKDYGCAMAVLMLAHLSGAKVWY